MTLIFCHLAKQRWLDEELLFCLSSLMGSDLSSLMGLQITLIFCHLAKQRWLDEELLFCLKFDGLSPFKLHGFP
jgi:regulator of replication initiation timing